MSGTGEWAPEGEPNPHQVFGEAREDTAAGRYPEALAKRIWFHRHALEMDAALTGVRLSYALGDWLQLAAVYPPALEALTAIRDENEAELRAGAGDRQQFIDFVAINRVLEQEAETIDLFFWLSENQPDLATATFDMARPALVRAKDYALCSRFLRPEQELASARAAYRMHLQLAANPAFGEPIREFGEQKFTNDMATLVALLAVNGRETEAQKIADEAKQEWQDEMFAELLERALKEEVPPPWPV